MTSPNVVCGQLVNIVKNSNLNFHISETAFSLKLSIKKSQLKIYPENRSNFPNKVFNFPPPGYPNAFKFQNSPNLENKHQIKSQDDYKVVMHENEGLKKHIIKLNESLMVSEQDLEDNSAKFTKKLKLLEAELKALQGMKEASDKVFKKHIEALKKDLEIQNSEVEVLKCTNKNLKSGTLRLNREINDKGTKINNYEKEVIKEMKKGIKFWKKELGRERGKSIQLEKKLIRFKNKQANKMYTTRSEGTQAGLDDFSAPSPSHSGTLKIDSSNIVTSLCNSSSMAISPEMIQAFNSYFRTCSMCAESIPNYVPRFSEGLLINPACPECDAHESDESNDTPG